MKRIMLTLILEVEDSVVGESLEEIEYFTENVICGEDAQLILHSNFLGENLGVVSKVETCFYLSEPTVEPQSNLVCKNDRIDRDYGF